MKSDEEPSLALVLEPEVISHSPAPPSILHCIEQYQARVSLQNQDTRAPNQLKGKHFCYINGNKP